MRQFLCIGASVFIISTGSTSISEAQGLTGSIGGTVRDVQGGVLRATTVTLFGARGSAVAPTDEEGAYRFAAVDPGTYEIAANLTGFQTSRQVGLSISVGQQLILDFTLMPALSVNIEVLSSPAIVDVKSSSSTERLSSDLLFSAPLERFSPFLLNGLPGVNNASAFGGGAGTANALRLDGVDTRDPGDSSFITSVNYDLIDEVQVHGPGAPPEYGGYTGVAINMTTKSGGNRFGLLLTGVYSNARMAADNISEDVVELNPAVKDTDSIRRLIDVSGIVSGPLVKDKLFFLVGAQREGLLVNPAGPRTRLDIVAPRLDGKLTWQRSASEQLSILFDHTRAHQGGAQPATIPRPLTTDDLAGETRQAIPVWSLQWRRVAGSRTLIEAGYLGYSAAFEFSPIVPKPGRFDLATGLHSISSGYTARYERTRHQVHASATHFAEGFLGRHDFKFGLQTERGRTRDELQFVNDLSYLDYGGAPYLAYTAGYDVAARVDTDALYGQDAWQITDRVTANAGARLDWNRGGSPDRIVYETKTISPRVGVAIDLGGGHRTVVKASYGRFAEALLGTFFYRGIPGAVDAVFYDVTGPSLIEIDRIPASRPYPIDPRIHQPHMDEIVGAFERALSAQTRLSLTAIWRRNGRFIDSVYPDARFTPVQVASALTGEPLTVYQWVNRTESIGNPFITNVDGFTYRSPADAAILSVDAFRTYRSVAAVLNRRLANGWQGQVSYVLAKAQGTVDNTGAGNLGFSSQFETPVGLLNGEGRLTSDFTHELKLLGSGLVPRSGIRVGVFLRAVSGQTYTPLQPIAGSILNAPQPQTVRIEPRGSRRLPWQSTLDIRIEKVMNLGVERHGRLGIYADIRNIFNRGAALGAQARVPNVRIIGFANPVPFGAPTVIQSPRQALIGLRWSR
ncbi:MAG: TonB-dependent receptor [Acidobacteria bacterium]|nr:TonB-dependent receptor [Acidobacteriota bacterium]